MANNSSDNISASKRKRLEAEAQRKKAKQEAFRLRLTGILIGLALLAVTVVYSAVILLLVWKRAPKTFRVK